MGVVYKTGNHGFAVACQQYHQHHQADAHPILHSTVKLWIHTKGGDIIMDRQEPNDSMHSSGEQRRTLGPGYLDSPLQRRNWVLLMLVVIFVGGAVVPNQLMKPLGVVLNIALLLLGAYLAIAAVLLELDCILPSWRWGHSALGSFLSGFGLLGMGLMGFYRESLPPLATTLPPFLLLFGGMLLERRKTYVL